MLSHCLSAISFHCPLLHFKLPCYYDPDFCNAGNVAFKRLLLCLLIPSLVRTSRTSPVPLRVNRDFVLDRVCVRRMGSPPMCNGDARSRVETEGGRTRAGLDILLRPSNASLRSVTPRPLVDLAKLCSDMFSMCIKAGEILSRGETPSPRKVASYAEARSTGRRITLFSVGKKKR